MLQKPRHNVCETKCRTRTIHATVATRTRNHSAQKEMRGKGNKNCTRAPAATQARPGQGRTPRSTLLTSHPCSRAQYTEGAKNADHCTAASQYTEWGPLARMRGPVMWRVGQYSSVQYTRWQQYNWDDSAVHSGQQYNALSDVMCGRYSVLKGQYRIDGGSTGTGKCGRGDGLRVCGVLWCTGEEKGRRKAGLKWTSDTQRIWLYDCGFLIAHSSHSLPHSPMGVKSVMKSSTRQV